MLRLLLRPLCPRELGLSRDDRRRLGRAANASLRRSPRDVALVILVSIGPPILALLLGFFVMRGVITGPVTRLAQAGQMGQMRLVLTAMVVSQGVVLSTLALLGAFVGRRVIVRRHVVRALRDEGHHVCYWCGYILDADADPCTECGRTVKP